MKCYIVKDLMPEYLENLCAEDTKKDIETHIAGCKKCQQTLKNMSGDRFADTENISPSDISNSVANASSSKANASSPHEPEAFNPFLKIQKRMKVEKRKKTVLIAALVIITLFCVYLGISQVPEFDAPLNYNKIVYAHRAKQIVQDLISGDAASILDGLHNVADTAGVISPDLYKDKEAFYNDTLQALNDIQKEAFPSDNYSIHVTGVYYHPTYSSYYIVDEASSCQGYYEACVTLKSGTQYIPLIIAFHNKNAFSVMMDTYNISDHPKASDAAYRFFDATEYYYASITGISIDSYLVNASLMPERGLPNYQQASTFNIFCQKFSKDCSSPITKSDLTPSELALLETLCSDTNYEYQDIVASTDYYNQINSSISDIYNCSETILFNIDKLTYNTQAKKINAILYWEINDANGNHALMVKRFYAGPYGFEAVDDNETIYADAGFDKELQQLMADLFDK